MNKVYIDRDLLLEAAKGTDAYMQIKSIVSGLPEVDVVPKIERNEARNDYVSLIVDIKTNGARDICDICKHQNAFPDCCADCDDCYSEKCVCRDCYDCGKWEWRGHNESQNT